MKLLRTLTVLVAMSLPGAALAQLEAENLLVGLPDGFVVANAVQGGEKGTISASEFIPNGETVDDWSKMVTIQVLHGATIGPDGLAEQVKTGWIGACPGSTVDRVAHGRVNGYRFSLWSFRCALNAQTSKPETMWLKAIAGEDALYIVQYAFRADPSEPLAKEAMSYLSKVAACDTRKPKHPCPKSK